MMLSFSNSYYLIANHQLRQYLMTMNMAHVAAQFKQAAVNDADVNPKSKLSRANNHHRQLLLRATEVVQRWNIRLATGK